MGILDNNQPGFVHRPCCRDGLSAPGATCGGPFDKAPIPGGKDSRVEGAQNNKVHILRQAAAVGH